MKNAAHALLAPTLFLACLVLSASSQTTSVVSHNAASLGSVDSNRPEIDDSGRWIVFESDEHDLVGGDTNGVTDVFLYDRIADVLERVSTNALGVEGDGFSTLPVISADGQRIVFESAATNFVPVDANGTTPDIVLVDRTAGTLQIVSRSPLGNQANASCRDARISDDGSCVAFASSATNLVLGDTNGFADVFVRELASGVTTRVSLSNIGAQPNGDCWQLDLSRDGRFVVFESEATNLVPGDTNGVRDLFLHDALAGTLVRVSVTALGAEADGSCEDPSLSANGRWLAFSSDSTNLVAGDTNAESDVFVKDLLTGATVRVSVDSDGNQGTGTSYGQAISPDGRFVSFESTSVELSAFTGPGTAIFLHDRQSGVTELVSIATDGSIANAGCFHPTVARDGRWVAFAGVATNLDAADPLAALDVYLRDREGGPSTYCVAKTSSLGCASAISWSGTPSASGSPFSIEATDVDALRNGLLFYGLDGPVALPFFGGTLCVRPPLGRTALQFSSGTSGTCDGAFAYDFDALIQSAASPLLTAGARVEAQYWYRDPLHPDGTGVALSDALDFLIAP